MLLLWYFLFRSPIPKQNMNSLKKFFLSTFNHQCLIPSRYKQLFVHRLTCFSDMVNNFVKHIKRYKNQKQTKITEIQFFNLFVLVQQKKQYIQNMYYWFVHPSIHPSIYPSIHPAIQPSSQGTCTENQQMQIPLPFFHLLV